MSVNNAVAINPVVAPVTPAPAIQPAHMAAPVPAPVVPPVESPAEIQDKKVTAAFIRQRQEIAELKRKQNQATPATPPAPAPVAEPAAQPVVSAPTVPAPQAVASIEEEKEAISNLGNDKDLKSIPGSIMEILDMVDASPRLKRLYDYDPTVALREAKGIFLAKAGVAPAPPLPVPVKTFGGMGGGTTNDLQEMINQCNKLQPGTREFTQLANKINVERNKRFRPTG